MFARHNQGASPENAFAHVLRTEMSDVREEVETPRARKTSKRCLPQNLVKGVKPVNSTQPTD
jgi:hypothetical protein